MIGKLPKSARTKAKLKGILAELCAEKGYQNVTVGDICDRAETYRSTFYRYYNSKDDMLRELENEYIEAARNLTPSFADLGRVLTKEETAKLREELTADMEYHRSHRKLCLFLLSSYGDPYFPRKMTESITSMATAALGWQGASTRRDYVLHFFAAGFISTVSEWLRKDDCSPEEIADVLLQLIADLSGFDREREHAAGQGSQTQSVTPE